MSALTSPPPPSTGGPSGPAYGSLQDAICRQVEEPSQTTHCHGSGDDDDDVLASPEGEGMEALHSISGLGRNTKISESNRILVRWCLPNYILIRGLYNLYSNISLCGITRLGRQERECLFCIVTNECSNRVV